MERCGRVEMPDEKEIDYLNGLIVIADHLFHLLSAVDGPLGSKPH